VPTRIEIELTSASGDGSWTWRAAGAREPKGVLDGSILPAGAAIGDQLRAESEHDVEGIRILSIVPPKPKSDRSDRLELLPESNFEPVIQQRAERDRRDEGRRRRGRDDRGPRDEGREGDRRRERARRGDGAGDRREAEGAERGERRHRSERPARPHFTPPPELPQRPRPKRLRPGRQHLTVVLESLPEEQRPVAELALQGMPAVRQRLREDNARSKAAGKPEMPEATVLKMAEDLLPQLRVAEWLDRADAAKRQLAHLDLRDLRSVVVAADDPLVARDESTRELAAELKAALATKQEEEYALWLADVEAAVDVGRVVRALRLSAEPPKAGVPFPGALGGKLGTATVAALTADDPSDRWIAVLEAAAFSPVRTHVTPSAAPTQPSPELIATVTRLGPLLPQVAALFSIEVPDKAPMPKPLRQQPRKKAPARKAQAAPKAKDGDRGGSRRTATAAAAGDSPPRASAETTPDTPSEATGESATASVAASAADDVLGADGTAAVDTQPDAAAGPITEPTGEPAPDTPPAAGAEPTPDTEPEASREAATSTAPEATGESSAEPAVAAASAADDVPPADGTASADTQLETAGGPTAAPTGEPAPDTPPEATGESPAEPAVAAASAADDVPAADDESGPTE
jgi:hypothetical protein